MKTISPKPPETEHPWQIYSYAARAVIATYRDRKQAFKSLESFWTAGTQVKLIYCGKRVSHDPGTITRSV
jgi:hypothetical protein